MKASRGGQGRQAGKGAERGGEGRQRTEVTETAKAGKISKRLRQCKQAGRHSADAAVAGQVGLANPGMKPTRPKQAGSRGALVGQGSRAGEDARSQVRHGTEAAAKPDGW
jgi:hypothetical protein